MHAHTYTKACICLCTCCNIVERADSQALVRFHRIEGEQAVQKASLGPKDRSDSKRKQVESRQQFLKRANGYSTGAHLVVKHALHIFCFQWVMIFLMIFCHFRKGTGHGSYSQVNTYWFLEIVYGVV